ncbi:hypothetical protein KIN20_031596 [Parelaphostrongylus tenuis]|uniref:Uncharacterized protein n=1 Tax=Parelaphostrongylus tenuis TaxID=148309 RepID=A0AAD5R714_PARTN|nr:hypothetical protein KIN20_031596 [Parelaphostrongylus tenuis]
MDEKNSGVGSKRMRAPFRRPLERWADVFVANVNHNTSQDNEFRLTEWASHTSPCLKQATTMDDSCAREIGMEIMLRTTSEDGRFKYPSVQICARPPIGHVYKPDKQLENTPTT